MMVQTGDISEISFPSASRRFKPLSTASATASDWGTVKHTVALMFTPW